MREHPLNRIAAHFSLPGTVTELVPLERGHIHDTCVGTCDDDRGSRFIFQRINEHIFRDVPGLMKNLLIVTRHLASRVPQGTRLLTPVLTHSGAPFTRDPDGNAWRCFPYIEHTVSVDAPRTRDQAYEGAKAFGGFLTLVADLPPSMVVETIPSFFRTSVRYEALERAILENRAGRVELVREEIEYALSRRHRGTLLENALEQGSVPRRVIHGDMKFNNVLFDEASGEGVCVVDLDTCMANTALYDVGDLVRSAAVQCAEDEPDRDRVKVDFDMVDAVFHGLFSGAPSYFTNEEQGLMPDAPSVLALTLGVRFLTDYLEGDHYFKTTRPGQNLDRCHTQFCVVDCVEGGREQIRRSVADAARAG
jgi:hypothetical protein